jgi:hypothetical protein
MEPGEGSVERRPQHIKSKDVDLHETDSSELSASTAGTSLPTVVLFDEENAKRLEEKKERKEERKKKREARQKKKEAQRSLKRRCKEKKLGG